jgi:hypothetical protein
MRPAIERTSLSGLPEPRRGKVRDVYDLGESLLIVATDRISAFDVVLSPGQRRDPDAAFELLVRPVCLRRAEPPA